MKSLHLFSCQNDHHLICEIRILALGNVTLEERERHPHHSTPAPPLSVASKKMCVVPSRPHISLDAATNKTNTVGEGAGLYPRR
jgi:hypothetical protein